MARGSGIATQALFKHAAKHARFERYLEQGNRRALQRSSKAAVDSKARQARKTYNLQGSKYGINKIKRTFRTRLIKGHRQRELEAIEKATSSAGIPLKDYGAKTHPKFGVVVTVKRGLTSRLPKSFLIKSLGRHVFKRKGKSRLPIAKRFGPGLSTIADQPEVREAGRRRFQGRIDEELVKEEQRARRRANMSNRVVETVYRLRDRVTQTLKRITKGYRGSANEAEKASSRIEAANRRQQTSLQGVLAAVGRMRFAYFAVAGAIAGAVRGIGGLAKAASDQENAERRLETAIRNGVGATDEQIDALKDLASERQRVTRFGDEETLSALRRSSPRSNLRPSRSPSSRPECRIWPNPSAVSAAKTSTLSRVGPAGRQGPVGQRRRAQPLWRDPDRSPEGNHPAWRLSKRTVAALSEALDANFKGMAESLTPYEQAARNASNASGDLVETLGSVITQNPTVTEALSSLTSMFEKMGTAVSENAGAIKRFVSGTVASLRILKNTADVIFDAILLGANRLQRGILQTARNIANNLAKVTFGSARETLDNFVKDGRRRAWLSWRNRRRSFPSMGENAAEYIEAGRDLNDALFGQAEAQTEVNKATREGADAAGEQAGAQDEQAEAIERTRRIWRASASTWKRPPTRPPARSSRSPTNCCSSPRTERPRSIRWLQPPTMRRRPSPRRSSWRSTTPSCAS